MKVRIFTFSLLFLAIISASHLVAMQSPAIDQTDQIKERSNTGLPKDIPNNVLVQVVDIGVQNLNGDKLELIKQLLESKKNEYAKQEKPKLIVEKRNRKAMCYAFFTSTLFKIIIIGIVLIIIWQPLGGILPAYKECTSTFDTTGVENGTNCNMVPGFLLGLYKESNRYIYGAFFVGISVWFGLLMNELRSITPTPALTLEKNVIGVNLGTIKRIERYVDMFKNPEKYKKYGAALPRGLLLVGPPGTGKTLIAKAIAGATQKPFFDHPATSLVSPEQIEKIFKYARKHSPSVLFIDEIDAIGAIDKSRPSSGYDDSLIVRVLNQLLIELGSSQNSGVIVIAATNYPNVLNPALVRSGRFDDVIEIPKPDIEGRGKLLMHYIFNNRKIETETITSEFVLLLSEKTDNFTASDFETLINSAALIACGQDSTKINAKHIEQALDELKLRKQAIEKKYC